MRSIFFMVNSLISLRIRTEYFPYSQNRANAIN